MVRTSVLIMRHGSTAYNDHVDKSKDRIRGHIDMPLDDKGRQDSKRAGTELKKYHCDGLVSSSLRRATESAHIVCRVSGVPYLGSSQGFTPWDCGKYAGQLSSKAGPILEKLAENHPHEPCPGGESFDAFRTRFFAAFVALLQRPGLLCICTHYRCMRLLEAWEAKGFPKDHSIDYSNFCKKGDPPGFILEMHIPQ